MKTIEEIMKLPISEQLPHLEERQSIIFDCIGFVDDVKSGKIKLLTKVYDRESDFRNRTDENTSGVYFIENNLHETIYIGQSKNLSKRVIESCYASKNAYRFKVLYCAVEDLNRLERYFISKFKPVRNVQCKKLKFSKLKESDMNFSEYFYFKQSTFDIINREES